MPRPRAPLVFGAGLDRATGTGARDPRSLFDARNVIAREAGVELRAGLAGTGLTALDWGTDVLATFSVERTLDVLQVLYDRASRDLRIYRVNPVTPPTRQLVGTWGTLNANAAFPVITHAEAGGVVYFAHAEEVMSYRLPTKYWQPGALDTDAGTLTTANADFDGSGSPGDIYFYGVCTYREYIAGWGWGTEADNTTKDRPEIVRMTRPDDPTKWPLETYFLCGTRSTRVIGCTPMPSGLLVGTRTQRYTIFGTDPETFGVELTDPSHGIVSPRAWQVVNGVAYTWSQTGPRVTSDPMAPSEDLAIPLDLMQAQPAGWPSRGPAREAFTGYEPEQRVLYWAWPNLTVGGQTQTMMYALSLRQPASPRFTAAIVERRVASAGRFLTGKAAPPAASGYAASLSFTDTGWQTATNGRTLSLTWTNTTVLGNETIEVWLKIGAGAWALHQTIATTTGTQSLQFIGRESLEVYNVALRHKSLEGTYTTGYTGATPDAWTAGTAAGSKATVTTGAATPTLNGTVGPLTFRRVSSTSANVEFSGSGSDSRCPLSLERNISGTWVEVASGFTGVTGTSFPIIVSANDFLAQTAQFRLRHKRGALVGTYSNTVSFFGGLPDAAPTVQHVFDASDVGTNTRAIELYVRAPSGYAVEVEVIATGVRTMFLDRISTSGYVVTSSLTGAGALQYRLRWAKEQAGVYDYSVWTSTLSLTVNPSGAVPPVPVIDATTLKYPGIYLEIMEETGNYSGNPNVTFDPPFSSGPLVMPDSTDVPNYRRLKNPTTYEQLLLFDHGSGVGYSAILFPASVAVHTAIFPQVGSGSVTYSGLRTFLVDPTTKRRGAWVTVAVPT